MRNKFSPARGFTLVEMLVVLAIVTILAGLITSGVMMARKQARINLTKTRMTGIEGILEQYKTDFSDYPKSAGEDPVAGNERLLEQLLSDDKQGPYIKLKDFKTVDSNNNGIMELADEWMQPLMYLNRADYQRAKPNRESFRLWCIGPDGVSDPLNPGSDDLVNWVKDKPDAE